MEWLVLWVVTIDRFDLGDASVRKNGLTLVSLLVTHISLQNYTCN